MIRTTLPAFVLALAAAASTSALALPHATGLHRNPPVPDTRIRVSVYNKGIMFRDVKIGGRVFTVLPHQAILVKAPAGTGVYAASPGATHRPGDLLFAITPDEQNKTIDIN
jgi:hypothetical protein